MKNGNLMGFNYETWWFFMGLNQQKSGDFQMRIYPLVIYYKAIEHGPLK